MLAAEAVYGLYEAAVEVGAPPHPGLLGPDVPPHHSAVPAAAHLLVSWIASNDDGPSHSTDGMELTGPGASKETLQVVEETQPNFPFCSLRPPLPGSSLAL